VYLLSEKLLIETEHPNTRRRRVRLYLETRNCYAIVSAYQRFL